MNLIHPGRSLSQVSIVIVSALLVLGTLMPAQAQHKSEESQPAVTEPSPAAPRLSVPEYRSPLSAYKPYAESDSPGWKQLNDQVGEIGGWRVYAREAFESDNGQKDSQ